MLCVRTPNRRRMGKEVTFGSVLIDVSGGNATSLLQCWYRTRDLSNDELQDDERDIAEERHRASCLSNEHDQLTAVCITNETFRFCMKVKTCKKSCDISDLEKICKCETEERMRHALCSKPRNGLSLKYKVA